ncbi:MAG: acyl carrier protein, partial [Halothiobacillaceae bacterium]
MTEPGDDTLKCQLKQMIAVESDRGIDPQAIGDDEPLFGEASAIQLDSLDLLQLSMAVYKTYGLKITGSNDARRAFV